MCKSYFRCNPAQHLATHRAAFSATAICKVQFILRCCEAELRSGAVAGLKRNAQSCGAEQIFAERNALKSFRK